MLPLTDGASMELLSTWRLKKISYVEMSESYERMHTDYRIQHAYDSPVSIEFAASYQDADWSSLGEAYGWLTTSLSFHI